MGICHYTLVQTHKMSTLRVNLNVNHKLSNCEHLRCYIISYFTTIPCRSTCKHSYVHMYMQLIGQKREKVDGVEKKVINGECCQQKIKKCLCRLWVFLSLGAYMRIEINWQKYKTSEFVPSVISNIIASGLI